MKRMISIALALLVCLGPASLAFAESDDSYRVDTLAALVCNALDYAGYQYTYDADSALITASFSLSSTLKGCDVELYLYWDGFLVKAYSPVYAAPEYLLLTSEYLGRASAGLLVGDFEMNYDTGRVWYKTFQIAEDSFPGYEDVLRALETSINMLDRYGNGLAKVALTGYDPATAVTEAEASY